MDILLLIIILSLLLLLLLLLQDFRKVIITTKNPNFISNCLTSKSSLPYLDIFFLFVILFLFSRGLHETDRGKRFANTITGDRLVLLLPTKPQLVCAHASGIPTTLPTSSHSRWSLSRFGQKTKVFTPHRAPNPSNPPVVFQADERIQKNPQVRGRHLLL